MRRLLIALGVLAMLAVAPAAFAGGWATVGLSSTPEGVEPGQPWVVDLTILQHGRTPLEGVEPSLTIAAGGSNQTFPAAPVDGKPGVYRATVTFPRAGRWEYTVDDGFVSQQAHTFPAVEIGGAAPASAPANAPATAPQPVKDGGPSTALLALGIGLLGAAAAILLLRDRRRPQPHQPQAA